MEKKETGWLSAVDIKQRPKEGVEKGEEDDNGNGSVVGIQGNCNYPTCSSHQDNSSDIKDDDWKRG